MLGQSSATRKAHLLYVFKTKAWCGCSMRTSCFGVTGNTAVWGDEVLGTSTVARRLLPRQTGQDAAGFLSQPLRTQLVSQ